MNDYRKQMDRYRKEVTAYLCVCFAQIFQILHVAIAPHWEWQTALPCGIAMLLGAYVIVHPPTRPSQIQDAPREHQSQQSE